MRITMAAVAAAAVLPLFAEIKMGAPFTDGAVLQRGMKVPVWGKTTSSGKVKVEFVPRDGKVAYLFEGKEPGEAIRTAEINANVSPVSKVPEVRKVVTDWLRSMRSIGDIVVEGRDIGSVVFPDSPARFYLNASAEARARRRHLEEVQKGISTQDEAAVKASLLNRDKIDSSRKTAPLKVADGAIVIDSTDLTIDEVLAAILENLPAEYRG